MGISFLEGLGYVAQGAAEKSEQLRQEKLAARMEEMKENRALYREIAKTRYATDLSTYQEEAKKVGKIQSVLANISKNNVHIDQATMDLIKADDKTYAAYLATDAKDQGTFAKNFQDTYFKKTYADDGTTVTGYSVNYPTLGLNMPKESDYFKGAEFWTKYAEEIESKTKGPLTKQVNKLLGREPNAENQVKLDMNIQGTNVYGDFDNQEYTSNNIQPSGFLIKGGKVDYFFDLNDVSEKDMHNRIVKSFEKITTKTNVDKNVVTFLKAFDGSDKLIEQVNGNAIVTADGANYYNGLYNHYIEGANKIGNAILMNGTGISGQSKYANEAVINSVVKNDISNRTIKLKNEKIFGGGSIDSNYIIPTGLDGTDFQIGTTSTGKLSSIFLNGDPKLLTRIENAINNNEDFKNFEGTIAQANPIIEGIIEMEIAKMREEGIKNLPPSFTPKDDVKADANVTDDGSGATNTDDSTKQSATETFIMDFAKENNLNLQDAITELKTNNVTITPEIENKLLNTTYTQSLAPQNVPPRPTGDGRPQVEARNEWDKLYGDTHNPDGTPILESNQAPVEIGTVSPRPTGQSGKAWDKKYKDTHNPDGTPKQ
jgi:hypothetical protein